jgi:hypothetical protein
MKTVFGKADERFICTMQGELPNENKKREIYKCIGFVV